MQRSDLVATFVGRCERIAPLMRFLASPTGATW
jgi:hypothetical protein